MSSQNKEATSFISRVTKLPAGPVSLDAVLQPSLDDEAELRKLFAADKANPRLKDPYVGLVDVFDAPKDIRTTRARVVRDDKDLSAKYVMPLKSADRRPDGAPSTVTSLEEFKKNWAIFAEGSLSQLLSWDNVVVAGGAVLACLSPVPEEYKESKRSMRQYFHDIAYKSSDVDLFLYGLTPQEAEVKIMKIYEAVRDSVPWDVTCVRTRHTVSIHSQYPYRCVQIVLRLYSSPAEILAGFDVDSPCFVYNGSRVFGNPRAIVAMMRQANTVDMTRRSPSYEVRLAKYSLRGFEIYVPNLKREDVDPTIYERSITRVQGLARLLVLEKLSSILARSTYLLKRSQLRGRPDPYAMSRLYSGRKHHNGDFKSSAEFADIELSDYDVIQLQIPYGPNWNAKRIEKLIYKTDMGMNSPWNSKNKGRRLHRHPAFFGTVEECLEDCCCDCPGPEDKEEHELQDEQDKSYVRGRINFVEQDPGRQSLSGSFNPIDEGEWSEQAYIQAQEKFFNAIASGDIAAVSCMIADDQVALDVRDQVGRTPLHVAIISSQETAAIKLIDAGARITPRLVGGRSSLHLAAQYGQVAVAKKLLERSAYNAQKVEEAKAEAEAAAAAAAAESDAERPSSEDDWSSEESDDDNDGDEDDDDLVRVKTPAAKADSDVLEDNPEEPDILDISLPDWDFAFTPLGYAILSGSAELVDVLLAAGADATQPTKAKQGQPLHPLTMTLFTSNEEKAASIAEKLVAAGASSTAANNNQYTIFHRIVSARKTEIVATLLRRDPNAETARNWPAWLNYVDGFIHPVITAISSGDYSTLAALVAHGAKLKFTAEDVSRAEDALRKSGNHYLNSVQNYLERVYPPLEVAIANGDHISLLLALGVDGDIPIKQSIRTGRTPQSLADWAANAASHFSSELKRRQADKPNQDDSESSGSSTSWAEERASLVRTLKPLKDALLEGYTQSYRILLSPRRQNSESMSIEELRRAQEYYLDVERCLRAHSKDLHAASQHDQISSPSTPSIPSGSNTQKSAFMQEGLFGKRFGGGLLGGGAGSTGLMIDSPGRGYIRLTGSYQEHPIPLHLKAFYDELYEACWEGDNARIEELCLPKEKPTSDSQEPIQITVKTTSPRTDHSYTGYSPLFVALYRRHWSTARLIIAIAVAQYKAPEDKPTPFNLNAFVDDSDDEGEDDSDSAEEVPIDFKDIAQRSSAVQCDCPPSRFFSISGLWPNESNDAFIVGNPLYKAVQEGDFETFRNILDLLKLSGTEKPGFDALSAVMAADNVQMLDEYIRRTGYYLPAQPQLKKVEPARSVGEKRVKTLRDYSGLKIGGKGRQDAPRASQPRVDWIGRPTLLREAAGAGAVKVIEYLASSRPFAAYSHYAEHNDDEYAKFIRDQGDFKTKLPMYIGWDINVLNESPMLSAILAGKFEAVKKLVELEPKLMTDALLAKVKFVGFTGLLTAAYAGAKPELFDFLLKHGCDPEERDARGWNVLHIAAVKGHAKLVKHIISILDSETVISLLGQISRGGNHTPLMLAVKRNHGNVVDEMTAFSIPHSVYLMKDSSGSSALHAAFQSDDKSKMKLRIVRLLTTRGPVELLHAENGVGQTPLDISDLQELTNRSRFGHGEVANLKSLPAVESGLAFGQASYAERSAETTRLRKTLNDLLQQGVISRETTPGTELFAFAEKLESGLKDEIDTTEVDEEPSKSQISTQVLQILREAVISRPGARQLVHILDVQRSAERDLDQISETQHGPRRALIRANIRRRRQQVDISDEVDEVSQAKSASIFSSHNELFNDAD